MLSSREQFHAQIDSRTSSAIWEAAVCISPSWILSDQQMQGPSCCTWDKALAPDEQYSTRPVCQTICRDLFFTIYSQTRNSSGAIVLFQPGVLLLQQLSEAASHSPLNFLVMATDFANFQRFILFPNQLEVHFQGIRQNLGNITRKSQRENFHLSSSSS